MLNFHVVFSESDWKQNQKAVLCALETYDSYQKEQVDSIKYIITKSPSSILDEPVTSDHKSLVSNNGPTTTEVMHSLKIVVTAFFYVSKW